jgi:FdhD protein
MPVTERGGSVRVLVRRRAGSEASFEQDALVVEEPLEVRLREGTRAEAVRFLVTMRTPGHDEDLAAGLLFGEGVIESADDLRDISRPDDPGIAPELARNVVIVRLREKSGGSGPTGRGAAVTSACGVCGEISVERVGELAELARRRRGEKDRDGPVVPAAVLAALPDELRRQQAIFRSTGGLHAAGLFTAEGSLVLSREDVGRHNATDKAIGAVLREKVPMPPILLVSGRLGFEIAQKAALAGVRILCAVSAPTSLAVSLAEETGMTLVGFLRGNRFNVYSRPERVG